MKLTLIVIFSAVSLLAQQPNQTTAKPNPADAGGLAKPAAPELPSTSKLWRLLSEVQQAQAAITDAQAKGKAAQDELQAEQKKLADVCGPDFTLGIDQDQKSPRYKDVVCLPKPKEVKPEGK